MSNIIRFMRMASRLKSIVRAGWAMKSVPSPESVADHSFCVALLALIASKHCDIRVDRAKCVALALIHDLAESIVGDITPHDGVSASQKLERETAAMQKLSQTLGDAEIMDLWREYASGVTSESKFVRDIDAIETVLQALEYEQLGTAASERFDEFWATALRKVTLPSTKSILEDLRATRRGLR